MKQAKPTPVHSGYGYSYYGCRCKVCRAANSERARVMRNRLAEMGAADPSRIPHGTTGGYTNWRCRCVKCTTANSAACAARRKDKSGAVPLV